MILKQVLSDKYKLFLSEMIKARKVKGLTQKDLALLLKKPQSFVSKYEIGERRLDVVEFIEIITILGFEPEDIITKIKNNEH